MKVRVVLRSGQVLTGYLVSWGPGWVRFDDRRVDDVVFWEVAR